jgi:hypothetical protein
MKNECENDIKLLYYSFLFIGMILCYYIIFKEIHKVKKEDKIEQIKKIIYVY